MSATIDALLAGGEPDAGSAASADARAGGKKVYTVGQYNRGVERRIREIPATWVKGVITQLQVRGKVVYLTLGEFEEGDARPKAVLDVILWIGQFESFNARFALLPTPFALRPELKVSLLLEAAFYVPTGRFQAKVLDVDESFTLGELALTRRRILDALKAEGLLERNKSLPMPEVPLRVGLISARGSAAAQDFTTVLLQSGFSFDILFAEARMQGAATEDTVSAALRLLSRRPVDVICIVRGGGSKTDLVFFDSEAICRAIALCPVPVLTGIGHEIDRSLADMVAHADLLTPTDCAKYLERRARDAWNRLAQRASRLRETWLSAYQEQGFEAIQKAEGLRAAWDLRARSEGHRQAELSRSIVSATWRMVKGCKDKLRLDRTGLLRGPEKLARMERLRFLRKAGALERAWDALRLGQQHRIGLLRARIASAAGSSLREARGSLDLTEKWLQASDPAALLQRGFARILSSAGRWIRGAAEIRPGDRVRLLFADGEAGARIEELPERIANKENPSP